MIRIYFVTYNDAQINDTLASFFDTIGESVNMFQVHVINNHSILPLQDKYFGKVVVLHNHLRPDFSTGHLARNWNQALILGFESLKEPKAEIVMTCQDDTIFDSNWLTTLLDAHNKYSFITCGAGDQLCSYLPEAVRKIGLWDERFCNIGFQEADYFLRALMYNKERSSINDYMHTRIYNPLSARLVYRPKAEYTEDHIKSMQFHSVSFSIFRHKYGRALYDHWTEEFKNNLPKRTLCFNYVYYPYFELDVENLKEKKYILNENQCVVKL